MEGLREEQKKMCSASGIWGLEAAEVMSLEQRSWEKNKSLSLFRSSLQSQQGWEGRGREGGLAGGRGRGCWEMVKDAKQALQPTLVAHIFVL
ncbi:hypothetical protein ABG768_006030 [Culter alburnus]|uniref:Uncharacterized protein n=1 Tax=Culter alburnus TaxID=194366 RepID=A0AAW1ZXH2_CULAL